MDLSSYSPYRGRSPLNRFLRTLLSIFLILLALAAGAFLYLQKYISYSSDGIHFNPPFLSVPTDEAMPSPSPSEVTVVVVSPEPTLPSKQEILPVRAVYLSFPGLIDEQTRAAALAELNTLGANGFILDMKPTNGALAYSSGLPLAVSARVSGGDTAFQSVLSELLASDYHSVARISCFRDNLMARAQHGLALTKSDGTLWYDAGSKAWLNPYSEEARQYLIGIAVELAAMGFDEILLDDLCFPTTGRVSRIDFGETGGLTLMSAVNFFIDEMKQALEPYPVILSAVGSDGLAEDRVNYRTGQSLTDLLLRADRLYLKAKETDIPFLAALMETASVSTKDPSVAFVPILGAVSDGSGESWALQR